jgi:hypothetical protein
VAANPQMLRLGRSFAAFPGKVNSGKTQKWLVEEQMACLQIARRSLCLDTPSADEKTGGAAAFTKIAQRFSLDKIKTLPYITPQIFRLAYQPGICG